MSRESDSARRELASHASRARGARTQGKLRAAMAAFERAAQLLAPDDPGAASALADEGTRIALALEAKSAPLAALSQHLLVLDIAPTLPGARAGVDRGIEAYPRCRPPLGSIAPREQLLVGATGAFWVRRGQRARVVVMKGGITTETVGAARQALEVAAEGVSWLLVDMKALGYVNSTGLAAGVKVAEGLEQRGGGLVFFSLASNLAVVIDTLGLGRHLRAANDLSVALAIPRLQRKQSAEKAAVPELGDEPSGLE